MTKRWISASIAGALAGLATIALSKRINSRTTNGLDSDWITLDGMDLSEDDNSPYFEEGDRVYLINPHDMTVYYPPEDYIQMPIIFEIRAVKYDKKDDLYRYSVYPVNFDEQVCGFPVSLSDHWIAEEWLDIADKPSMYRKMDRDYYTIHVYFNGDEAETPQDNYAEIDYWLATLHHSTDESERKQAKDRLRELTSITEIEGGKAE